MGGQDGSGGRYVSGAGRSAPQVAPPPHPPTAATHTHMLACARSSPPPKGLQLPILAVPPDGQQHPGWVVSTLRFQEEQTCVPRARDACLVMLAEPRGHGWVRACNLRGQCWAGPHQSPVTSRTHTPMTVNSNARTAHAACSECGLADRLRTCSHLMRPPCPLLLPPPPRPRTKCPQSLITVLHPAGQPHWLNTPARGDTRAGARRGVLHARAHHCSDEPDVPPEREQPATRQGKRVLRGPGGHVLQRHTHHATRHTHHA